MDLPEQLRRQLRFIDRSCHAYDSGDIEEALRIAVALRVIFHDTGNSTSLLKHLGKKESIQLISTMGTGRTAQEHSGSFFIYLPLMITMQGVEPPLGDGPPSKVLRCDLWWNEIILAQSERFSRRDVVLSSANQDGGAHVDIAPSKRTRELKDGVGTFTRTVNSLSISEELVDHHFPLLRQIGYEVLNSPDLSALA